MHDSVGDLPSRVLRQGNVSMHKAEHHDRQTFILAVLGTPESPPNIYRVADHKGNVILDNSSFMTTPV